MTAVGCVCSTAGSRGAYKQVRTFFRSCALSLRHPLRAMRRSRLLRSFSGSMAVSYLIRLYRTNDSNTVVSSQNRRGTTMSVGTLAGTLRPLNQLAMIANCASFPFF